MALPEYSLRGLEATITENRLQTFYGGKWKSNLTSIPGLGTGAKEVLNSRGIKTLPQFLAKFMELNCEFDPCLEMCQELFQGSGAKYRRICLLILHKLSRQFDIPSPPLDWRSKIFPNEH